MRSWLSLAVLALVASGCGTPPDPERTVFGVSGDREGGEASAEADAEMRRFLDWKLNQICTLGYETVKVDTLPAEDGRQLVDEEARCGEYHLTLF
jgi:hypothetical protein